MRITNSALFCLLLPICLLVGCAQKLAKTPVTNQLQITSRASINPVIKGLRANPLIRVRVYIPASGGDVWFRRIACTIDESALRDVQKLDVFFTGSEPLFRVNEANAITTPAATTFDMLVNVKLTPGLHYMWISATLKDSANLDNYIELHANALVDDAGKRYAIEEENAGFRRPIGIAIRKAGDDGVHTYRIPGMISTGNGTLIAVYDIRYKNSGDLPGNIDVGMSRSTDGGKTWAPMKVIMDMGAPHENNGVGDPCILFDPVTNKIWVAALWSKGNRSIAGSKPGLSPDETGQFVLVSSSDDGLTWSQPQSITPQVKDPAWRLFFPGPGSGISMQNGNLVFPAQYWDADGMPHSTLVYSADHGDTWKSGTGAKSNTTESAIIETAPGTLMLNMRDNRGSFRTIATTNNMGASWAEHHTSYSALPDPVCMASLIKANVRVNRSLAEVVFFSNVANENARNNLTVKASTDLGESWLPSNALLLDERKSFGYSSLCKIDEQTIGILYEGFGDLYFVRVPVADVVR